MHDGSQYIDIILFACVAVFLILRLRGVLGQRTGEERQSDFGQRMEAPKPPVRESMSRLFSRRPPLPADDGTPEAGLARIAAADPGFLRDGFIQGATNAFQDIVAAFNKGDEAALRPLLSDEVFVNFTQAIRARQEAGEICENRLEAVLSADILEARMEGSLAMITVGFASRQIICEKDAQGRLRFGDPDRSVMVNDRWRFARDIRSRDPSWHLVATQGADA